MITIEESVICVIVVYTGPSILRPLMEMGPWPYIASGLKIKVW